MGFGPKNLTRPLKRQTQLCHRIPKKTSKNHKNQSIFRIQLFLEVFGRFLKLINVNEILTSYRQLTRRSSLDRHPYRVFCDKDRFCLFKGLVRFSTDLWGVQMASKSKKNNFSLLYMHQIPNSRSSVNLGVKL